MCSILAQIIPIVLDGGENDWMKILVFVIISLVYGLGQLLKSKSKKLQLERERQPAPPPKRPSQKRPTPGERPISQPQAHRPARQISQRRYVPATVQAPTEVPTYRTARPAMRPPPAATTEPTQPARAREVVPSLEPPAIGHIDTLSSRPRPTPEAVQPPISQQLEFLFSEPDELERAIVHFEILSKPLSLREPTQ